MIVAEASGLIEKVLDEPLKHLPPIIGVFGGLLVLILQTAFNDHLKKEQRGLLLTAMFLTVWLGYFFGAKLLLEYAYSENITIGLLLIVIVLLFALAPLAGRLSQVAIRPQTLSADLPSSTPGESSILVAGEATSKPNAMSDSTTTTKSADSRAFGWVYLWPPSDRALPRWVASLYVMVVLLLSIAATNHFALESNCILLLANPKKAKIVDLALIQENNVKTLHKGVTEDANNHQYYRVVIPKLEFAKAKGYMIDYMLSDDSTTSTSESLKSEFFQSPSAFAFGEIWVCHYPTNFQNPSESPQSESSPTPTPTRSP